MTRRDNTIISRLPFRATFLPALLAAVALVLLCGCTDDLTLEGGDSGSRTEITLSLDTDVPFGQFRTRAGDAMGNSDVTSLWVGVYDIQTGNRVGAKHFSYPSSPVTLPVLYYDNHPEVAIVGVANYGGVTDWDGTAISEKLDAADTWNAFMDLNVMVPLVGGSPVVDEDRPQIMMGLVTGPESSRPFFSKSDGGGVAISNADYSVNLSPSSLYGSMIKTITGKKLFLRRLSAQVNVNIIAGSNAEVTDVSYRRCNLPKGVFLAERPTYNGNVANWGDYVAGTPNFADTKMVPSNGQIVNSDSYYSDPEGQWVRAGRDNTFSFAHYENRHWGTGTNPDHSAREAIDPNKKDRKVLARLGYEYNNFASYFVVRMTILDKEQRRSAQVEYVIHEGNINNTLGELQTSNERARDFSAFRNTVYNYNITVNGIDYITYNVSNVNPDHHDAASGVIWEAEVTPLTNQSASLYIERNSNLLFRFYIGRGPDTAPTDYLNGNVPDGMGGMYWPAIDGNTASGYIPTEISNRFTIQKGYQTLSVEQFINDARSNGGTYTISFNPPDTQTRWEPDAYKMGFYYYNPGEKSNLSGIDGDQCTWYSGKKFHVVEWKPGQKTAQNLNSLSSNNLPTATVKYTDTQYITLNFSSAHWSSGNGGLGTYGTDYVYIVRVNGKEFTVGSDWNCTVPLAAFGNGMWYSVQAESLNSKTLNSSAESWKDITVNGHYWDFSTDEFAKFFHGHFYTNLADSQRYKSPDDYEKHWYENLYICIRKDKEIGRLYENPPYLYYNNTGDGNGLKFTVYKNCKITIQTYLKKGDRQVVIKGADPEKITPQNTDQVETFSTNVTLAEGETYKDISIYYTGSGGGYFVTLQITN